ncbi:exocrine gland-secreted peptide 1-like [Psammomys obesus]|uniref:exocrine gland-secreted peptide 1-like n=1 Tax=Psammomys obesus TaxID=48139 RepID=UPI002452DF96|nr:exocrine gland-secreted peptide 1-like [Psammomys obesus]
MNSLPAMLFLTTLLLPSMFTEGRLPKAVMFEASLRHLAGEQVNLRLHRGLWQQPGPLKSAWSPVAMWTTVVPQATLERMLCSSDQDQTLFEDLASANQHKLNISKILTALRKCCTQNHQLNT